MTHIDRFSLKDGCWVEPDDNQFLCWSESGRRMELWQAEPLRLLRHWLRKSVHWVVEADERSG